MGEILNIIKSRRSVRNYKPQQIVETSLENILDAARFAPTGQNSQSWHFTAVQNSEILEELNVIVEKEFQNSPVELLRKRAENPDFSFYYKAPTFIIVSAPKESNLAPYDAGAALQNIFLAAYEEGIGSVWIHALTRIYDNPDVRKILSKLGIPENHAVTGSAAIGYIEGNYPDLPPRKEGTFSIYR